MRESPEDQKAFKSAASGYAAYAGEKDTPEPEPKAKKEPRKRGQNLDSAENNRLFSRLMGYYLREIERQRENRTEQDLEQRCYDNDQWSEADKAILRSRGQKAIVLNVVATTVDWILGTELRARVDYKVLARQKSGSGQAERKTEFLKYLSDINRTPFHRSRAFADAVKCGVGWLEDAVQGDEDDEDVVSRYESWRNMLWDSAATELDLSDASYMIRSRWVDADVAKMWFPKRAAVIDRAAQNNTMFGAIDLAMGDEIMDHAENEIANLSGTVNEFNYERPRVRLIEVWHRTPTDKLYKMRGGQFSGEIYDPWSPGHAAEIASGEADAVPSRGMQMNVAIMTTAGLLYADVSPYRHGRFPFTPVWCYRRDRDNMPYGVIRRLRGIQEDINARASKALHILSTNKVVMDEGAVEDLDEFVEEVSRADAVIVKKQGKELTLNVDRDLAPAHMDYLSRLIVMVEQAGGVTNENLGRETNARSGIAVQARQEQGTLSTAIPFDMLRYAFQVSGGKQLSLIEQFFTKSKMFRIANQRGVPSYQAINDPDEPESLIAYSKADFIIAEDAWSATIRAARGQLLVDLMTNLGSTAPEAVLAVLDLVIDALDVPNRDEIVQRIREVNGQGDPDADEPTPEEMARKQAQAEQQERMIRMQEAEIGDKEAGAKQKFAAADKLIADAQSVAMKAALDGVSAQLSAMQAAIQAISAPGAAPVADVILKESGFVSQSQKDEDAAIDAEASELEALAAEGAAMQEAAAAQQQPPADPTQQQQPAAEPAPAF